MKIYRASYEYQGNNTGFTWHLTKTEAKKSTHKPGFPEGKNIKVDEFEVYFDKYSLIQFLSANCSYADNG